MKLSLFIEDGLQQLIFTPENKYERDILQTAKDQPQSVEWHRGNFGHCQGGWVRHWGIGECGEDDFMLILKRKTGERT